MGPGTLATLRRTALCLAAVALLVGCPPPDRDKVRPSNRMEIYDPASDTWQKLGRRMPEKWFRVEAATVAGEVYLTGGGGTSGTNLLRYDPTADVWEVLPRAPAPRTEAEMGVLGTDIYLLGGHPSDGSGGDAVDTVEVFDTVTATWTTGTSMITPRARFFGVTESGGALYVIGGWATPGPWSIIAEVEAYDPGLGVWQPLAPMPVPADNRAESVGGLIYAIASGDSLYVYDPSMDSWSPGPPPPLSGTLFSSEVIGDEIFINQMESRRSNRAVHSFDTVGGTWTRRADRKVNTGGAAMGTSGGLLYVFGGYW